MTKRKVCFLSLAFLTGIAAAEYRQFLLWQLLFLYTLVWVILIGREYRKTIKTVFWIFLFLLAVSFGICDSYSRQAFLEHCGSLLKENTECLVQGKIYQKEKQEKNDSISYYLKNCKVQFGHTYHSCNQILLNLKAGEYAIGEILCVKGKIKPFALPVNEGNYNERGYYQSLNIDFGVEGEKVLLVKGQKNMCKEQLLILKERMTESYQRAMPKKDAGVLSAMVLGEKGLMDDERKRLYQSAGISHIIAISGLHISMLGMAVYHLIQKKGGGYFAAGMIAGTFILGYGTLIGFGISASRAIGMFLILLYAKYRGRSYDRITALALMAALLAGRNPGIVHNAGYLLSFGAVCGVIFAEELMLHKDTDIKLQKIKEMILVSFCIQLITIPVMCQFFYEISVYTLVINMAVLPCMGVLLGLGIFGGAIGCVFPFLGKLILYPCYLILLFFDRICELFAKLPQSSLITGTFSAEMLFLWYGLLFAFVIVWKKKRNISAVLFLLPMGMMLFGQKHRLFEIDILDVGQGDGIYISAGDNTSVFIDGGSTDVSKAGIYRILPFLKYKGIRRIDYWFVSHCDADHISGLCEIIDSDYKIRHLVVSAYMPVDDAWKELKALAKEKGIDILTMREGDAIKGENDNWQIQCVAPTQESPGRDRNANSMALLLQHEYGTGFFGGDMGEAQERELVRQRKLPETDVYKASHHGSDTSNGKEILDALRPKIAVISCGMDNRYGHPGKETLERLEEAGSLVYETRYLGQIKIMGTNLEVKGFSVLE